MLISSHFYTDSGYNYLKENGAVDFAPLQPSAPRVSDPASGVPAAAPSSASSADSTADNLNQIAQALNSVFSSPLEGGTYTFTGGAVPVKISLVNIAKSGSLFYNRDGRSISGTYSIDGNTMTVRLEGRTFVCIPLLPRHPSPVMAKPGSEPASRSGGRLSVIWTALSAVFSETCPGTGVSGQRYFIIFDKSRLS